MSCDVMYPVGGGGPPRGTPPPAYRPPYPKPPPPYYSPPESVHSAQSEQSSYTGDVRYMFDYDSPPSRTSSYRGGPPPDPPQDIYSPPMHGPRKSQPPPPPPQLSPPSPRTPSSAAPLSVYKPGPPKPPRYSAAVARRRTWSPPTFYRVMGPHGPGASLSRARAFRSNDQLDSLAGDDGDDPTLLHENIYEEPADVMTSPPRGATPPPNIAPISGQLNQQEEGHLIRPVAFKPYPVAPAAPAAAPSAAPAAPVASLPSRYVPTPARHTHCSRLTPPLTQQLQQQQQQQQRQSNMRLAGQYSHDDGYVSQDYHGSHAGSHTTYSASTSDLTQYADDTPPRRTFTTITSNNNYKQQRDGATDRPHHAMSHEQLASVTMTTTTPPSKPPAAGPRDTAPAAPSGAMTSSVHSSSTASSCTSSSSSGGGCYVVQTPSPSDSGVGELEAVLRDKDAEIRHLRGVMERNETAIFQVFEEKRQNWEVELHEVTLDWERRLKQQQQKSFRTEQGLLMQLFQIQQDRKTMRGEIDNLQAELAMMREKMEKQQKDSTANIASAENTIKDVRWEKEQKNGEIHELKQQINDSEKHTAKMNQRLVETESARDAREREVQRLKEQLDLCVSESGGLRAELDRLHRQANHHKRTHVDNSQQTDDVTLESGGGAGVAVGDAAEQSQAAHQATAEVLELHNQVDEIQKELVRYKKAFSDEKAKWLEEKSKVIQYQRHLQLNYTQMQNKNVRLESDIQQLMLELESRDSSGSANESVCSAPTTTPLTTSAVRKELRASRKTSTGSLGSPSSSAASLRGSTSSNGDGRHRSRGRAASDSGASGGGVPPHHPPAVPVMCSRTPAKSTNNIAKTLHLPQSTC